MRTYVFTEGDYSDTSVAHVLQSPEDTDILSLEKLFRGLFNTCMRTHFRKAKITLGREQDLTSILNREGDYRWSYIDDTKLNKLYKSMSEDTEIEWWPKERLDSQLDIFWTSFRLWLVNTQGFVELEFEVV